MAQAYLCYAEALRIQPTFAIAWSNLAGLLMEAGELQRALNYYKVWHVLASHWSLFVELCSFLYFVIECWCRFSFELARLNLQGRTCWGVCFWISTAVYCMKK
jgi:tetratricopeptide (TPR) repeat protein